MWCPTLNKFAEGKSEQLIPGPTIWSMHAVFLGRTTCFLHPVKHLFKTLHWRFEPSCAFGSADAWPQADYGGLDGWHLQGGMSLALWRPALNFKLVVSPSVSQSVDYPFQPPRADQM